MSILQTTVFINVYIGNYKQRHGVRRWPCVPRIGEKMCVEIDNIVYSLKVKDVTWGITKASRENIDCEVDILVSKPR